eukprot:6212403-Pleurochrysis_carterae.AAC.1
MALSRELARLLLLLLTAGLAAAHVRATALAARQSMAWQLHSFCGQNQKLDIRTARIAQPVCSMDGSPLRVGIIGAGPAGLTLARALSTIPGRECDVHVYEKASILRP